MSNIHSIYSLIGALLICLMTVGCAEPPSSIVIDSSANPRTYIINDDFDWGIMSTQPSKTQERRVALLVKFG